MVRSLRSRSGFATARPKLRGAATFEVIVICVCAACACILGYRAYGGRLQASLGFTNEQLAKLEDGVAAAIEGSEFLGLESGGAASARGRGGAGTGSNIPSKPSKGALNSAAGAEDPGFAVGGVAMDEAGLQRAIADGHFSDDTAVVGPNGNPTTIGEIRRSQFVVNGVRMSAESLRQAIADGHFSGDTQVTDADENTMTVDQMKASMGLASDDPVRLASDDGDNVRIGTVRTEGDTQYVKTWNGWREVRNEDEEACYQSSAGDECRSVSELQDLVRRDAQPTFRVEVDGETIRFEDMDAYEQWRQADTARAERATVFQENPDGTIQELQSRRPMLAENEPTNRGDTDPDVAAASDGPEFRGALEEESFKLGQQLGSSGDVDGDGVSDLRIATLNSSGEAVDVQPATHDDIEGLASGSLGGVATAALEVGDKLLRVDAVAFSYGALGAGASLGNGPSGNPPSSNTPASSDQRLANHVRSKYGLSDDDVLVVVGLGETQPETHGGVRVECTAVSSSWVCAEPKIAKNIAKDAGAIDMGNLALRHNPVAGVTMIGSRAPLNLDVPGFDIGPSRTTSAGRATNFSGGSSSDGGSFDQDPLGFTLDSASLPEQVTWADLTDQFKAHVNLVRQRLPAHLQPKALKRSYKQFMDQLSPNARLALNVAGKVARIELRERTSPILESAIDDLPKGMRDDALGVARRAGLVEEERNFRIEKNIAGGTLAIEIETGDRSFRGLLPGLPTGGGSIRFTKTW